MYQHLMAAVELDDNAERVLKRALELSRLFGARLTVLHVVEYVAIDTGEALMAAPPDLTNQLLFRSVSPLHRWMRSPRLQVSRLARCTQTSRVRTTCSPSSWRMAQIS